ncbi:MAG: S8 family serine peptidase [Synergistaceae bacterium]|nr:S8 family serine peptidase [Synergistaceae bacterium]
MFVNTCRKFILCALIVMLAVPAYSAEYVPGDVLVVFKPSEGVKASSFAAAWGASVKEVYSALSGAGSSVYALLHSETKNPEDLTAELLANPDVLAASPNYKVRAAVTPNDTFISQCWGLSSINAPAAWDITSGDSNVYVAIIDSGIDETNPDLTDNVATEYGTNTAGGSSARDDQGHGTHVAGTIGAVGNNSRGIAGVNWNVGLISVKALDSNGSGTFAGVIAAIDYVTGLIQQGVNVRAVNLSLETYIPAAPEHDNLVQMPLWRAFKDLDALNQAVIVCAAGNYAVTVGQPTTYADPDGMFGIGYYVYPASFNGLDNLISVSALDTDGTIASFSNTNATISAPGVNILSTWLQNSASYRSSDGTSLRAIQGTSMAAPHVAGAAALLASAKPNYTAYQLKRAILDASGEKLDLLATLNYQAAVPEKSTEWTDYDDYEDYTTDEQSYSGGGDSDSGGSGGCGSLVLGAFALLLIVPIISARFKL